MKWFKHDSNANTDAKLQRVRMKYGMEGYGLYWYLLELIAAGVEKHNITFELEHDSEIIAFNTGIHRDVIQEMMTFFVEQELLENSAGLITCLKMASRTDDYIGRITTKTLRTNSEHSTKKVVVKRREENRVEEKRIEKPNSENSQESLSPPPANRCPTQKIVDLYHEVLPILPQCKKTTSARGAAIRQRHFEDMEQSLETWRDYFEYVKKSDFLMGKTTPTNGGRKPFRASLDWLCKADNFAKIFEGKYHG